VYTVCVHHVLLPACFLARPTNGRDDRLGVGMCGIGVARVRPACMALASGLPSEGGPPLRYYLPTTSDLQPLYTNMVIDTSRVRVDDCHAMETGRNENAPHILRDVP